MRCLPDEKQQNFAWISNCSYCPDRDQNLVNQIFRLCL